MINSSQIYLDELNKSIVNLRNLENFKNKSFLITGATGLICSYLIDLLMTSNEKNKNNIKVVAMGRSMKRGNERFLNYLQNENFHFLEHDIINEIPCTENFDYIIHGASNANPISYSEDPVGTMLSNFLGMKNILDFAKKTNKTRVLYISSGEVYGETNSDYLKENDYGYVDILNPRSCYPSSKRATETLCASYAKQYSVDTVIARPCHIYGPTVNSSDSRASNQFIQNGINKMDIILKSSGSQIRSYCYIDDCVSALFKILLNGHTGEAYNISAQNSTVSIKQLAEIIAEKSSTKVILDSPNKKEKEGYSPFSKAVIDNSKLMELGWTSQFDIEMGIDLTINILKGSTT